VEEQRPLVDVELNHSMPEIPRVSVDVLLHFAGRSGCDGYHSKGGVKGPPGELKSVFVALREERDCRRGASRGKGYAANRI